MFASIGKALTSLHDPAIHRILVRSVLYTIALFAGALVLAEGVLLLLPGLGKPDANRELEWKMPLMFAKLMLSFGAPVAALFASLFLDEVAAAIEARSYPQDAKAPGNSFRKGLASGIRLTLTVIMANLLLWPVSAISPGFGWLAKLGVNAYLLGREYFELAALRHLPRLDMVRLRRRRASSIFGAGLVLSLLTQIPLVNLFAPLFGAALMVHLFRQLSRETPA